MKTGTMHPRATRIQAQENGSVIFMPCMPCVELESGMFNTNVIQGSTVILYVCEMPDIVPVFTASLIPANPVQFP